MRLVSILRQRRRPYGCGPSKGPFRNRWKAKARTKQKLVAVTTQRARTQLRSENRLPEMSNCRCYPSTAGGPPWVDWNSGLKTQTASAATDPARPHCSKSLSDWICVDQSALRPQLVHAAIQFHRRSPTKIAFEDLAVVAYGGNGPCGPFVVEPQKLAIASLHPE